MTSHDGNCPRCKSTRWKTLEAMWLFQRRRTQSTTTGGRTQHHRESVGTTSTVAAVEHLPPTEPGDYAQLENYRQMCQNLIAAAEDRLAEIDAARLQPNATLPGLFKSGPEKNATMFELYAKKLDVLTGYEADLARWKATKICERCAATFVDVSLRIPKAAAMSFCFVGQERRCPHCASYFWKVPEAVADEHEATANAELNRAKQQLHEVEQAAIIAAKKPVPMGFLAKLAVSLRFAPMSSERARAMLDEATRAHRSTIDKVHAMRTQARSRTDARWCVECKTIYPGVFAPPSKARSCNPA